MSGTKTPVVVLGGGLAGLSAAWEVAKRGHPVTIYEASYRLGGKAGSEDSDHRSDDLDYWSDHGYHLFPPWYRNVRRFMGETGLDYEELMVPGERFLGAVGGFDDIPYPLPGPMSESTSPGLTGMLPFFLTLADLVAADDPDLEATSVAGFLRSRFPSPICEHALPFYESLLLKALSGTAEELSALTIATMFRCWFSPIGQLLRPTWSALRGSLQQTFIEPIQAALGDVGCAIEMGHSVSAIAIEDGSATSVTSVTVESAEGAATIGTRDTAVVSALPNVLAASLVEGDPRFGGLGELAGMMEPMSAVDVIFNAPVDSPEYHFGLIGSPNDLTGYNIFRVWPRTALPGPDAPDIRAVWQMIAARTGDLADEPDPEATLVEMVGGELDDVGGLPGDRYYVVHTNLDAPLLLNNVGIHDLRPDLQPLGPCTNLWLAGDYMPSSIDVASMEAAVASGRTAGRGVACLPPDDDPPHVRVWWRPLAKASRLAARILSPFYATPAA